MSTPPTPPPLPRRRRRELWPVFMALAIVVAALYATIYYILGSGTVRVLTTSTESMSPTLHKGDQVIVLGHGYRSAPPQRGDIVLYRTDDLPLLPPGQLYLHRVVGLPGETLRFAHDSLIADGQPVHILSEGHDLPYYAHPLCQYLKAEGDEVKVPEGAYFVIGDNSHNSVDSRVHGPLPAGSLVGPAVWRKRGWHFTRLKELAADVRK